jgi:SAM-dependent methyltransferase
MMRGSIAVRRYHLDVATPEFPRRDPADPAFWDLRYEADFAPWDAGKVPSRLREFVEAAPSPLRTLVPGCGSAWDVRFLAERGWDVTGIDFSAEALAAARGVLGPHGDRVRQADVFAPIAGEPFDLVYERAFLCALPRRLWPDWSRRMASLVAPGALLAGFFYFEEGERGPPFPLHSQEELDGLLAASFERIADLDVRDSIPVFAGKERWQRWQRR